MMTSNDESTLSLVYDLLKQKIWYQLINFILIDLIDFIVIIFICSFYFILMQEFIESVHWFHVIWPMSFDFMSIRLVAVENSFFLS